MFRDQVVGKGHDEEGVLSVLEVCVGLVWIDVAADDMEGAEDGPMMSGWVGCVRSHWFPKVLGGQGRRCGEE
jgi:hypothetical protein